MDQAGKGKRITGAALELIMQDVLRGMQTFTRDACAGCSAARIEVLSVEHPDNQPAGARIIPFPKTAGRR